MKLVVPLTIPWMRSTCAAASVSCSTRMTGTTPATAPSKRSWTPCSRAQLQSSSPCEASSSLLAETTCLPARMAASTYSRAGSMPPISSTIRSEPSRISVKSPRERVSTPPISGLSPVIAATASARSASSASNAPPTVPWPSSPTLNVPGIQVLEGLAAHDRPRAPARPEPRGGARHAVVVVGHGIDVGARDRHGEDVAGARLGQARLADQHVAGLAVLAHHGARRARRAHPVGEVGLVGGVVEHRAPGVARAGGAPRVGGVGLVGGLVEHGGRVVAQAAVDGHEAPRPVLELHVLARLARVERHAGPRHERPAGLQAERLPRPEHLVR